MSRRHNPRAMNPHAYDPWRHNRVVARRRAYRRWAVLSTILARQLRAIHRSALLTASALRQLEGLPGNAASAADLAALRRTYLGDEDDE